MNVSHVGASTCDHSHPPFCPSPFSCFSIDARAPRGFRAESHAPTLLGDVLLREYLSTGYLLRCSTEIYGRKRETMVFHKYLQECWFVLRDIFEHLRKPTGSLSGSYRHLQTYPETSGFLLGECNLGILYSSSLLSAPLIFGTCGC